MDTADTLSITLANGKLLEVQSLPELNGPYRRNCLTIESILVGENLRMDGVFALSPINPGSILSLADCKVSKKRTITSVQVGFDDKGIPLHVEEPTIAKMNNAWIDTANAFLHVFPSNGNSTLRVAMIAAKPIFPGEQVTFCYAGTESEVLSDTALLDDIFTEGEPRKVHGFLQLNPDEQQELLTSGLVSSHIVDLYIQQMLA